MSGSGPTVFGLFGSFETAEQAFRFFKEKSPYQKNTYLCDFT